MAGTTTIKFSSIPGYAGEFTIKGPSGPSDIRQLAQDVSDYSSNNTRHTYRVSNVTLWIWTLNFENLTHDQWTSVQDLVRNYLKGPGGQCTYHHTDTKTYRVRIIDQGLEGRREDAGTYSTSLRLELSIQPDL